MAIEKTERLTVRWKPSDINYIEKKSKEAGVSKSRYVREVALCERNQDGEKISRAAQFKELIRQVRAIGNNINQIALHGNQRGQIKPERFEEVKGQLDQIALILLEAKNDS